MKKNCLFCKLYFDKKYTQSKKKFMERKYCSKKCFSNSTKGIPRGTMDKEIRMKISSSNKGKNKGVKNGMFGKPSNRKGVHLSEEIKRKLSESQKGEKHWRYSGGKKIARKRWSDKNKEYLRKKSLERLARKSGSEGSHTLQEWEKLKKTYKYMCLCCKRTEPEIKLTEDHIIPLSMSGTDYIWNIQPLCRSCNSIKHTKTIDYRKELNLS